MIRGFRWMVLSLLLVVCAWAQEPQRPRIQVQNYTIDADVNPRTQSIVATAKVKFTALHPDFGYLLYPARWFPIAGYTVDRFTADLRVTTPSEYRVVASGDLKTDAASNGRTIYSFHYDKASFPGSIAIVKGDPVRV